LCFGFNRLFDVAVLFIELIRWESKLGLAVRILAWAGKSCLFIHTHYCIKRRGRHWKKIANSSNYSLELQPTCIAFSGIKKCADKECAFILPFSPQKFNTPNFHETRCSRSNNPVLYEIVPSLYRKFLLFFEGTTEYYYKSDANVQVISSVYM